MVDDDRCDERKCAELLASVRGCSLGPGVFLADPDRYSRAEVRAANMTLERDGSTWQIVQGTITKLKFRMHGGG